LPAPMRLSNLPNGARDDDVVFDLLIFYCRNRDNGHRRSGALTSNYLGGGTDDEGDIRAI